MRIAYVEDNPTNLALVERVASMNQHVIVSYNEGEVALQELQHEKFDLILMDVELAGELSGLQVVRQLRTKGLRTPIVAVTAYAMMGDRDKCLEAGCNDYLPKPLPIRELIELLQRYDTMMKNGEPIPVPMPIGLTSPSLPLMDVEAAPTNQTTPPAAKPAEAPEAVKADANGIPAAPTVPTNGTPAAATTPAPAEPAKTEASTTPAASQPGESAPSATPVANPAPANPAQPASQPAPSNTQPANVPANAAQTPAQSATQPAVQPASQPVSQPAQPSQSSQPAAPANETKPTAEPSVESTPTQSTSPKPETDQPTQPTETKPA